MKTLNKCMVYFSLCLVVVIFWCIGCKRGSVESEPSSQTNDPCNIRHEKTGIAQIILTETAWTDSFTTMSPIMLDTINVHQDANQILIPHVQKFTMTAFDNISIWYFSKSEPKDTVFLYIEYYTQYENCNIKSASCAMLWNYSAFCRRLAVGFEPRSNNVTVWAFYFGESGTFGNGQFVIDSGGKNDTISVYIEKNNLLLTDSRFSRTDIRSEPNNLWDHHGVDAQCLDPEVFDDTKKFATQMKVVDNMVLSYQSVFSGLSSYANATEPINFTLLCFVPSFDE